MSTPTNLPVRIQAAKAPEFAPSWLGRKWHWTSLFEPALVGLVLAAAALMIHAINHVWHLAVLWQIVMLIGVWLVAGGATFFAIVNVEAVPVALWTVMPGAVAGILWLTTASGRTPTTLHGFYVIAWIWVGLVVVGTVFWPIARDRQNRAEWARYWARMRPPPAKVAAPPVRRIPKWEKVFAAAGFPGAVRQCSNETFDERGNTLIRMRVVDSRYTVDTLRQAVDNVETALANVNNGMVKRGIISIDPRREGEEDDARDFIVTVNTANVLAQNLFLAKDDTKPRSIRDLFLIAKFKDGTKLELSMTAFHIWISGQTGDGKTTLFDVFTYYASLCRDCVIFGLDFKHGAWVRAWLQPWADGATDPNDPRRRPVEYPVFDWAGLDRWEAERMFNALLALKDDRALRYGAGRYPDEANPFILVMVDEISQAVGHHVGPTFANDGKGLTSAQFDDMITNFASGSRSTNMRVVKSAQRATVSQAGSGDQNHHFHCLISFRQPNQQEASYLLPGGAYSAAAAKIRNKGEIVCYRGNIQEDKPMQAKVLTPPIDPVERNDWVYDVAITRSNLVGRIVEGSRDYKILAKYGYADRWSDERAAWLFPDQLEEGWTGCPPVSDKPEEQAAIVDAADDEERLLRLIDATDDGYEIPVTRVERDVDDPELAAIRASLGDDFFDQVAGLLGDLRRQPNTVDVEADDPEATSRKAKALILDVVRDAGSDGTMPKPIVERLIAAKLLRKKNATQIYRWLGELKAEGLVEHPFGDRTPWYAPEHRRRAA